MQAGFTLKKVRVVSRRGGVREEHQPWGASGNNTKQLHPLCYRCKACLSSPSHMARWATTPKGLRDGVSERISQPIYMLVLNSSMNEVLLFSTAFCFVTFIQVKFRTLFCNGACFKVMCQQTGAGGTFRQATGAQDKGICQCCGLDCFRLVSELKAIPDLGKVCVTLR